MTDTRCKSCGGTGEVYTDNGFGTCPDCRGAKRVSITEADLHDAMSHHAMHPPRGDRGEHCGGSHCVRAVFRRLILAHPEKEQRPSPIGDSLANYIAERREAASPTALDVPSLREFAEWVADLTNDPAIFAEATRIAARLTEQEKSDE